MSRSRNPFAAEDVTGQSEIPGSAIGRCVHGQVSLRGTSATAFDPERLVRDGDVDRFELSAQPPDPLIGQTQ